MTGVRNEKWAAPIEAGRSRKRFYMAHAQASSGFDARSGGLCRTALSKDLAQARKLNECIYRPTRAFYADLLVDVHSRTRGASVLLFPRCVPPMISRKSQTRARSALVEAGLLPSGASACRVAIDRIERSQLRPVSMEARICSYARSAAPPLRNLSARTRK
jgi:hypothetical protein